MQLFKITTKNGNLFIFRHTEHANPNKHLYPIGPGYYCTPDGTMARKVENATKELRWAMKNWTECVAEEVTGLLKEKVFPLFDEPRVRTFGGKKKRRNRGLGGQAKVVTIGKVTRNTPFSGLKNLLAEKTGK